MSETRTESEQTTENFNFINSLNSEHTKKQLAKIYYQNREVQDIDILFDDQHYCIYIGVSVHISGKDEIITMDYDLTKQKDDKELSVCQWEVKDYLDKV